MLEEEIHLGFFEDNIDEWDDRCEEVSSFLWEEVMDDDDGNLLVEKNPHRSVFLCEEKKKKRQIHQYLLSFSVSFIISYLNY